ncbi:MAG: FAD:protein FMN transferase [Candidatus Izemoplasmatales bacterium]|nr:FAD:protein FMN transferase [Candidatus Izemoplasmatales bacterium]
MKKALLLIILTIFTVTLTACGGETTALSNPNPDICIDNGNGIFTCEKRYTSYFDTVLSLKIYINSQTTKPVNEIFQEFEELTIKYHQYFDKYHAYSGVNNLYTINNSTGPITIDRELFDAIVFARNNEDIYKDGDTLLFNIALHPLLEVWHNARNSGECDSFIELGVDYCPVPTAELNGATFNINPEDIILNEESLTIDFAKDDMGLDLGGFAKGYFSEIMAEHLNQYNINYILNLGQSNVYAHGQNLTKQDGLFYIALTTPFRGEGDPAYYAVVKLSDGLNLVSSGNYQRYFKNVNDFSDETLYHHIIDPRTYYPGGEVTSLTVLYDNAAIGDILSTTLYLMTLEEGLEFVNNTEGLEALWYVDKDNIVMSDNFADYLMEPIN